MPGAYSAQNSASFLMSVIRHSDISKVNYDAIGREAGITAHSAYCRLNNLKKELKAGAGADGGAEPASPTTPRKKRGTTTTPKSTPAKRKAKNEDDEEEAEAPMTPEKEVSHVEESPSKKVKSEKDVKKEEPAKVKKELVGRRRARVIREEEEESDHEY